MNAKDLGTAFLLGIHVAEHVNGIAQPADHSERNEAIIKVLQQVARGDVMLYETPEEFGARFPTLSDDLQTRLQSLVKGASSEERRVAGVIVQQILG
jgi:hypothetical protein